MIMKAKHKENITLAGLVGATLLAGGLLTIPGAIASTDVVDEITITVPPSCSLSSTGGDSHTAEISNGQTNSSVGESTIKTYCNDNNGFSIYAIGYTDDELGKTVLTSSTLGQSHDILTGTNTTGNSSWAMKLSTITTPEPTYPLIIAGSTNDTDKEQGDPDYTSFQEVPDDYTLVAKRKSGTDTGTNAEGATLKTTYQVHISNTQSAGTYTGQVKYTMVHPYNTDAPEIPMMSSCSSSPMISTVAPGITHMQDINSSNRTTVLGSLAQGATYQIKDNRDNETYCVGKLADDNLWMLDNLALDLTDSTILNSLSSSNTNIDQINETAILTSLKSGNRSAGSQYATAGVGDLTSGDSYSVPLANLMHKYTIPSDTISVAGGYKIGGYYNFCAVSAGSYCYDNDPSQTPSHGNTSSSICPNGWRLPIYQDPTYDYKLLYSKYNNDYAAFRMAMRLPLTGSFFNGSMYEQSNNGRWWSSSENAYGGIYVLYSSTNTIGTSYNGWPTNGMPIRCILDH